jgi:nucleobase transporter 1/2
MTVSTLIILLALSSVQLTVEFAEKHWISLVMIVALFITVLYCARLKIPLPGWNNGKFYWARVSVFGLFPYLTAILFTWFICWILTIYDLVPSNSPARTDKNETMSAVANAPFIRFPYPGN